MSEEKRSDDGFVRAGQYRIPKEPLSFPSDEEARWQEFDATARRIVLCTDPTCTPDNHVQAVRFALLAAFNEGWLARAASSSSPDTDNEREAGK